MKSFYSYSFLVGMFIGGYTNFFSKVVISGLIIYISHPEKFDIENFDPLLNKIKEVTYPYISKVYKPTMLLIENIDPPLSASNNPSQIKLKIPVNNAPIPTPPITPKK